MNIYTFVHIKYLRNKYFNNVITDLSLRNETIFSTQKQNKNHQNFFWESFQLQVSVGLVVMFSQQIKKVNSQKRRRSCRSVQICPGGLWELVSSGRFCLCVDRQKKPLLQLLLIFCLSFKHEGSILVVTLCRLGSSVDSSIGQQESLFLTIKKTH